MPKNNKGFGEKTNPKLEEQTEKLKMKMEECGGDFMEYMRRNNRHTLRISLTDEQVGKELWGDKEITFFNEDNAISHLSFLSDFLDELLKEENNSWGTGLSNDALVERLTNFVKERVAPPTPKEKKGNGNTIALSDIASEDMPDGLKSLFKGTRGFEEKNKDD